MHRPCYRPCFHMGGKAHYCPTLIHCSLLSGSLDRKDQNKRAEEYGDLYGYTGTLATHKGKSNRLLYFTRLLNILVLIAMKGKRKFCKKRIFIKGNYLAFSWVLAPAL